MSLLGTMSLSLYAGLAVYPALSVGQEPATNLPKQMRIITASLGGTGPDFIARLIAPKFTETARVNTIVDNRPSVNGIVAAQFTARATPDGSVIMMGNAGYSAINAALCTRRLRPRPAEQFRGITEIASVPLALVIHPVVPAKSVKELIAVAPENRPGS